MSHDCVDVIHGSPRGRERVKEREGGEFLQKTNGYIENDLMENDLKSFFRAFSSLGNWIMI